MSLLARLFCSKLDSKPKISNQFSQHRENFLGNFKFRFNTNEKFLIEKTKTYPKTNCRNNMICQLSFSPFYVMRGSNISFPAILDK